MFNVPKGFFFSWLLVQLGPGAAEELDPSFFDLKTVSHSCPRLLAHLTLGLCLEVIFLLTVVACLTERRVWFALSSGS